MEIQINTYRNNNKNKSILINQLKINRKTLEILESSESSIPNNKKSGKIKSLSSRNNKLNNLFFKNTFSFNLNLPKKSNNIKLIKISSSTNDEKTKSNNKFIQTNYLKNESLTERNNNFLKTFSKSSHNFKSRNIIKGNFNEFNFPSINSSQQNSKRYYAMNINKYKNILKTVFSRIKSSLKKKKHFLYNIGNYNHNKSISVIKRKYSSPINKIKNKPRISLTSNIYNEKHHSLSKLEDFEHTLENEFNCKELIKLENGKLKQKLKKFKLNIYNKTPIYKTTEKLNNLLIRQFNLDKSDQKNAFNKKFKIYRASVNKIQEMKNKNLYHEYKENNPYEKEKLLEKEIEGYNEKDITKKSIKKALNKYYRLKTKKILEKKSEIERELIDLKTKFKSCVEKEKYIRNENNIKYGELNQVIQTKLLYKEIYGTDIDKKKKKFYDENTLMLHKVRRWSVPIKVVKKVLKQKTINKYKANIGAYFGAC